MMFIPLQLTEDEDPSPGVDCKRGQSKHRV